MREGYIAFVKKYKNLHPEHKNNLKAIKSSLLSFGATEEEFNEAIRQITAVSYTHLTLPTTPYV